MPEYKVVWIDENDDTHYTSVSAKNRLEASEYISKNRKTFKCNMGVYYEEKRYR